MIFHYSKPVEFIFTNRHKVWQTRVIYQGLQKSHSNSQIPIKKPKNGSLSKEDKRFNRQLARQRIAIEHINRRLKIFKILSLPYRNRRRRFGLRCNLIAVIYNFYNFEVSLTASKTLSAQA